MFDSDLVDDSACRTLGNLEWNTGHHNLKLFSADVYNHINGTKAFAQL